MVKRPAQVGCLSTHDPCANPVNCSDYRHFEDDIAICSAWYRWCYTAVWDRLFLQSLKARFMGPTWGPSGADRTQVGPMLAPWTLLSGVHKLWIMISLYLMVLEHHYSDVIMYAMASQNTGVSIVCSNVCSDAGQRKYQSSASLGSVMGIHRWPVDFPHKGLVTRKMFHLMTSSWCLETIASRQQNESCHIMVMASQITRNSLFVQQCVLSPTYLALL